MVELVDTPNSKFGARESMRVRLPLRPPGHKRLNMNLIVDPSIGGISWEKFLETAPRFSIALDGYVNVGPRLNLEKMVVNFNHHEEVDRLATRATCGQVLMAIRQGMFSSFRDEHGPVANVHVNDCDEDVCTSWALLNNSYMASNAVNPLVNKLVSMEDALDSTAGAYPFPSELPVLQELAWVFEPYRQFRLNHGLETRNAESFKSIITDVELRILQYVTGHGKTIPLNTKYKVIGGGDGWSMVEEIGMHARTGMFGDGIQAYVSVRYMQNGNFTYTIGKLSPFIPLDLLQLTASLNQIDPLVDLVLMPDNTWGGGNNIIGSPRHTGSGINPGKLQDFINKVKSK